MRVHHILLGLLSTCSAARHDVSGCINISTPSANYSANTATLQAALDSASATKGCVVVSGGDYPVAPGLFVGSDTHLRLEAGSRLVNVVNVTRTAVVHVRNAQRVLLDGGGTLYGDAEHAWSFFSADDDRMSPYIDDGNTLRTNLLRIEGSAGVEVYGLRLHNSTDWTLRMDNSSDLWVEGVDIYGDSRFPNNDGFDPQSCRNVTLRHSAIDVADDGICPKADKAMGELAGLYVHNVTIRSKSHAIKFGSNTDTTMRDIVFDNITIWDSNGGLSVQQRSEGDVVNVTWSNIVVETRLQAPRWWGNGEWLGFTNAPRGNGHATGAVRQHRFVNISGRSESGGLLSGLSGPVGATDISFENVHITIAAWGNYSTGAGPRCYATGRVCSNDTGAATPPPAASAKCTGPRGGGGGGGGGAAPGAVIDCMGTRDYRPTLDTLPAATPPRQRGGDRVPSKADALFLENVHGVSFKNVTFEFEAPRRPWFGACLAMDRYTDGVTGADGIKCINGPPAANLTRTGGF